MSYENRALVPAPARRRRWHWAWLPLAATLMVGCRGANDAVVAPSEDDSGYHAGVVTPPFRKPSAILTDTSNRAYDFARETDGQLTLLYVGYTHCPDVCPTTMVDLDRALEALDPGLREKIKVVFVTADPERDTPPVLRKWLDLFDSSFIGLTSGLREIQAFEAELGMPPGTRTDLGGGSYSVSHAAYVIAFTPDNQGHLIFPFGFPGEDWVHDLTRLVQEGWNEG